MSPDFFSQNYTTLSLRKRTIFLSLLICDFLSSSLDRKISLSKRHGALSTIGILGNEVASVAAEDDIIDLSLSPLPQRDHFPDAGKMIFAPVTSLGAGIFCPRNHRQEVIPLGVAKKNLNIAGQPILITVVINLASSLEIRNQAVDCLIRSNKRRDGRNLGWVSLDTVLQCFAESHISQLS